MKDHQNIDRVVGFLGRANPLLYGALLLALLVATPLASLAADISKVDIAVSNSKNGALPAKARASICEAAQTALKENLLSPVSFNCHDPLSTSDASKLTSAAGTLRVTIVAKTDDLRSFTLSVDNWLDKDTPKDTTQDKIESEVEIGEGITVETDAGISSNTLSWNLDAADAPQALIFLKKRLTDLGKSIKTEMLQRDTALMIGSFQSKTILVDKSTGQYRDRETGDVLSFQEAQDRFVSESPKNKHYLRSALEIGAMLGGGCLIYNTVLLASNSKDWDMNASWASQRRKLLLGEGIRFDDNAFYYNNGHSFAGAFYYLFARTNGMNSLESTLVSIASSALWETIAEYHEVLSINDMIATPLGGATIGEVFYQLTQFLDSGEKGYVTNTVTAILGGPSEIHQWVDKNHPVKSMQVDSYGLNTNVFHEFNVFAGAGVTTSGAPAGQMALESRFGFSTELITVPGYGRAGKSKKVITDAAFTQMFLETGLGQAGLSEFRFFAQSALFGYYQQDLATNGKGQLDGYSIFVGASTAYDIKIDQMMDFNDEMGVVNVLGPTLDATFYYKGFKVRAKFDAFADFAQVRSVAIEKYMDGKGYTQEVSKAKSSDDPALKKIAEKSKVTGMRSILEKEHAYYAYGITTNSQVAIDYGPIQIGARLKTDTFASIQGGDRYQESVTDETKLTDNRLGASAWIAYIIPDSHLVLKLEAEKILRTGTANEVKSDADEERFTGSALWRF